MARMVAVVEYRNDIRMTGSCGHRATSKGIWYTARTNQAPDSFQCNKCPDEPPPPPPEPAKVECDRNHRLNASFGARYCAGCGVALTKEGA